MHTSSSKARAAPPPPPLPPPVKGASIPPPAAKPPFVAATGPAGAFLVELLIFDGAPFKDHWAYFVRSNGSPHVGVQIHAIGDVMNGFNFQVKRSHDFRDTNNRPTKRIQLQWVSQEYFDEKAMFNNGKPKLDTAPVCVFEASAYKVRVPGKTLTAVNDNVTAEAKGIGKKITQRNCQTWIVESADQLVKDCIFSKDVAAYLHAIEQ
ncbi:MAG: hypothetical protein M1819_004477 [Sarea resinae]|nr:MAG: hypothetical protein M1819_004477 [Sarea resinae]